MVEVLKQPQFSPFAVEDQVMSLYAVTNGFMDKTPVSEISRFEEELTGYMRRRHGHVLRGIAETGAPPDIETLDAAIAEFAESFRSGD